jgi:hypothetical protein
MPSGAATGKGRPETLLKATDRTTDGPNGGADGGVPAGARAGQCSRIA